MNIVETDFWCLMLPPEWSAEEEEDSVLITDQDGIGELAITTLVGESGDTDGSKIVEIANEESPEVRAWSAVKMGAFSGVTGQFIAEGAVLNEWYLGCGAALLYCTYTCDVEDDGLDIAAVEDILGTLVAGDGLLPD